MTTLLWTQEGHPCDPGYTFEMLPGLEFHAAVLKNKTFLLTANRNVKDLCGMLPTALYMTLSDSL